MKKTIILPPVRIEPQVDADMKEAMKVMKEAFGMDLKLSEFRRMAYFNLAHRVLSGEIEETGKNVYKLHTRLIKKRKVLLL